MEGLIVHIIKEYYRGKQKMQIPTINYQVPLNSNKQNASIKANVLSDKKMRDIGFTDFVKDTWYFCKILLNDRDIKITFNVRINKNTHDVRIDVLDEGFLQPYDYQEILRKDRNLKCAKKVHDQVQEQMKYLMCKGVITGYTMEDYI